MFSPFIFVKEPPLEKGFRPTISPQLTLSNAAEAISFYKRVFGAEEVRRARSPDGRIMHAELKIGHAMIAVCDDFPEFCGGKAATPKALGGSPVCLNVHVTHVDAVVTKVAEAGATVRTPPMDMFWGDRYARFTDPFGHEWAVLTRLKDVPDEEIEAAAKRMFFAAAK